MAHAFVGVDRDWRCGVCGLAANDAMHPASGPLRRCHVCFNVHQGEDERRCPECLAANRPVAPWVERYERSLKLQGRRSHGDDVPVSETVVAHEAEWGDCVPVLRYATAAREDARARAPVIVACSDHVAVARSPGSTRDKSYWTQVAETVVVSLAFVALGLLIRWWTT